MDKTKSYLICVKESGGCDYTIGCGYIFYEIIAESIEEALSRILDKFTMGEDANTWDDVINIQVDYFISHVKHNENIDYTIDSHFSESYISKIEDLIINGIGNKDYYKINPKKDIYPKIIEKIKGKLKEHEDDPDRILFEKLKAKFEPGR